MKRTIGTILLLAMLLAVVAPQSMVRGQSVTSAAAVPQVSVKNQYALNRYGFVNLNETIRLKNNLTTSETAPDIGIGLGNLTSDVVMVNATGAQLSGPPTAGVYTIVGGESLSGGSSLSVKLNFLINGVVTHPANGSLIVNVLTMPYVSLKVRSLQVVIAMPASTQFASKPKGFASSTLGTNTTYTMSKGNVTISKAVSVFEKIGSSSGQDFHPLDVYSASRTITVNREGRPQVTDRITFQNLGSTTLSLLTISPLTSGSLVTVVPSSEPPLLNPVIVVISNQAIDLSQYSSILGVGANSNYTISYQYPLDQKYYSISGGQVTLQIPAAPPIPAFVSSYQVSLSLPSGMTITKGTASTSFAGETPFKTGTVTMGYSMSLGWALNSGVPVVSVLFVALLLGLFVSRTTVSEEEETEEETSTERASAMIKAFEDKTSLINQILAEIPTRDPNERDKVYFDELRGRLDAYRSRALQRLNEVKQKSTTQKFFDLLNQLHATEREVDRAAKDMLNLFEQYYTNRMRKEVFDRLSPSYKKRLEKAIDQLSEELHVAQREAKLL